MWILWLDVVAGDLLARKTATRVPVVSQQIALACLDNVNFLAKLDQVVALSVANFGSHECGFKQL